jgi:hypothetical protein
MRILSIPSFRQNAVDFRIVACANSDELEAKGSCGLLQVSQLPLSVGLVEFASAAITAAFGTSSRNNSKFFAKRTFDKVSSADIRANHPSRPSPHRHK